MTDDPWPGWCGGGSGDEAEARPSGPVGGWGYVAGWADPAGRLVLSRWGLGPVLLPDCPGGHGRDRAGRLGLSPRAEQARMSRLKVENRWLISHAELRSFTASQ